MNDAERCEKIAELFMNQQLKTQKMTIKMLIIALIVSAVLNVLVIGGVVWFLSEYDVSTTTEEISAGGDYSKGDMYKDSSTHNEGGN